MTLKSNVIIMQHFFFFKRIFFLGLLLPAYTHVQSRNLKGLNFGMLLRGHFIIHHSSMVVVTSDVR